MLPPDEFLIQTIQKSQLLKAEDVDHLIEWWISEQNEYEEICDFLIRQKVLLAESKKTLQLCRKGFVKLHSLTELLQTNGLQKLQAAVVSWKKRYQLQTPSASESVLAIPDKFPASKEMVQPEVKAKVVIPKDKQKPNLPAKEEVDSNVDLLGKQSDSPVIAMPQPSNIPFMMPPRTPGKAIASPNLPNTGLASPQSPPWPPPVGTQLGKCILMEMIGMGGSGAVFRAFHQGLAIPVAVKLLNPELREDAKMRQRIQSEARLLAQLNHNNIVRVLDCDDGLQPYVVMEYVEGFSLSELIQQTGWLRLDRTASIIVQVINGLDYAIRGGLIHRDIKPGNLLVSKTGVVKIADLGLALTQDFRLTYQSASQSKPTEVSGTIPFMAPERYNRTGICDHRSDIFSLGVTIYQCLTGTTPWPARTITDLREAHANVIPKPVHTVNQGLPSSLSLILDAMMALDINDRIDNYDTLRQLWEPYKQSDYVVNNPESTLRNKASTIISNSHPSAIISAATKRSAE